MAIGPIQIFYFKFDEVKKLENRPVRKAIADLRGKGLIRLIDVYFVSKELDGTVTRETASDLSDDGQARFGAAIKKAMGLDTPDEMSQKDALDLVGQSLGLTATDLQKLETEIEPGQAGLVMMFEHTWAIPLREALKEAGGHTVMQAFLSPDAVAMIGGEVNAILKAQQAVEEAEKIRNAARIDALVSMAGAQQIAQLAAARAEEAVITAEIIEESAAEEAAAALAAAEMVRDAAMQDAISVAVEAEEIKDAAMEEAAEVVAEAELVEEEAEEEALEVLIEADEIEEEAAIDVAVTLAEADAIKRAAVADTLRVLYEAGQIEDAAMAEAISALATAGMIEAEAQERAEAAAEAAAD